MAPTSQHLAAERTFRALLEDNGLAPPDEVEYDEGSVVFIWREKKLVVVVDLDEPPPPRAKKRAAAATPRPPVSSQGLERKG